MALLTDLGIRRAKLWHFRFHWQGKQQRISFGTFSDVDLKTARERREEARSCLANSIDPRIYKVTKQAEDEIRGIAFATFVEQWKVLKLKKLGTDFKNQQSTRIQIERYLRKDLLPVLA
jgi:hypothetical protein